ncbi:MAG: alpha-amylase family glycosyl hydrolase [Anaerolineae bacterium]
MTAWPKKPFIYEINTYVWLNTLSRSYKHPLTLENVPDKVLDELASYHVDAIWLMGIWQRSAAARDSAHNYLHEYQGALPDLTPDDVPGSPYAVGAYQVDEHFGGRVGLALFRKRLRDRGMRLVLDYVPNHVATDHAWIAMHSDYMVLGNRKDLKERPSDFFKTKDFLQREVIVAHGRDPYFPGWIDTAQLNAFSPGLRRAALTTLLDIASQCDAVRCDMAMLMVNDIFAHTWGSHAGERPETEYWMDIIPQVKKSYPHFKFIAEVYWDMEARLHGQGFDFCYDKRLYDRMRDNKIEEVRAHLVAHIDYQNKLVRFIENHDEHRAASAFGIGRSLPAAVLICTLPGATLLHDGQFLGRKIKLPVQLGRQPTEKLHRDMKAYYLALLAETRAPVYQDGEWWMFNPSPGKADGGFNKIIAYGWRSETDRVLVTVNMDEHPASAHVSLEFWPEMAGVNWTLHDVLDGVPYVRDGNLLLHPGLYVDLKGYQSHIFHFSRA